MGDSPKGNRLLKPVGAETVNTVSLLAAVCDTLSAAYGLLFSAGLSECRFSVPAPSQAALFRLLSEKRGYRKIISHPASHSVVTGIWAAKKPAHQCVPTVRKRTDLSLCDGGFTFM